MNNESLQSYYQVELSKLSTLNNTLKDQNIEIKVQYEEVIKQMREKEIKLIEKDQLIDESRKQRQKYIQINQQLNYALKQKHIQYKSLYNYTFVDNHLHPTNDHQIDLFHNVNQITYDHYQQHINSLKSIIKKRNQTLKQLLQENNRLKYSIIQSTQHYQKQNIQLKTQLQNISQPKHTLTKVSQPNHQLEIKCQGLKISLNLANNKIDTLTKIILSIQQQQQPTFPTTINNNGMIKEVLQIMKQNQQLKQENSRLNEQIVNLTQQFPQLFQNKQSINGLIRRYKELENLQETKRECQIRICNLEDELKMKDNLLDKISRNQIKMFVFNSKKYQQMSNLVVKLKKSLQTIDPYFNNLYRYNSTGILNQNDIQIIESDFTKQIQSFESLYQTIGNLNIQITHLQQLTKKNEQKLKQKQNIINQQRQQINHLKALINQRVFQSIKQYQSQINYPSEIYQKCIRELQCQRQSLCQTIRVQQIEIGSLIGERDHYRERIIKNNIIIEQRNESITKNIKIQIFNNQIDNEEVIKRINETNLEIKKVMMGCKEQFNTVIKEYDNKILQMHRQIATLSEQKQQRNIQTYQRQPDKHHQSRSNGERVHQMEMGIIQHQLHFGQESELPLNTISQQSIAYMTDLLNNHQAMLKSVLQQYDKLKNSYNEALNRIGKYQMVENVLQELKRKDIQIKTCLVRINQADINLQKLEQEKQYAQQKIKQIQIQKVNEIKELKQRNEKLQQRQKLLMQTIENIKSQMIQSIQISQTNNHSIIQTMNDNPVVSLLNLLTQKKDQINNYKMSIKVLQEKVRKAQENQLKTSSQNELDMKRIENDENKEIVKLVKEGPLIEIIQKCINVLKNIQSKHKQHFKQII